MPRKVHSREVRCFFKSKLNSSNFSPSVGWKVFGFCIFFVFFFFNVNTTMYGFLKQIYKVFFWWALRSSGPDGGSNQTNNVNDGNNVEGSMFKLVRWKISFLKWPLSDCRFFFLFFFSFSVGNNRWRITNNFKLHYAPWHEGPRLNLKSPALCQGVMTHSFFPYSWGVLQDWA